MRTILITAALAGCQSTAPQQPEAPGSRCAYGYNADSESCNPDPYAPVDVPTIERHESVATEKPIDDYDVAAVPGGATGWKIHIVSKIDAVGSLIWDESTFVTSDGRSMGRLITGETRRIDTAKAQPAMPIAPRSDVVQFVLPEKLLDQEEFEGDVATKYRRTSPANIRKLEAIRKKRGEMIVGGKLYVTVLGPNGKQTWTGVVTAPSGSE